MEGQPVPFFMPTTAPRLAIQPATQPAVQSSLPASSMPATPHIPYSMSTTTTTTTAKKEEKDEGGISLVLFLLGAAAIGIFLVKLLTDKFPWEEKPSDGGGDGGGGGGEPCAGEPEIRCAEGYYAVCDEGLNKWTCVADDSIPKPTPPPPSPPSQTCTDPPPASWGGCSELDAQERDVKETCTLDKDGKAVWTCTASCKAKPPLALNCDDDDDEIGYCNASTDHYWKCVDRGSAPQGACGLATTKPTCESGIAPVCVEQDDRSFVWQCATRNAAAIAREEGLEKVVYAKYGSGTVDLYLKNGIPVYPAIGAACGENSQTANQWRGGLSDADLEILANPRGALVSLDKLLFVPMADMADAGLAVYKNRHGVYCVRVNPCRDSTGKLRGFFRQDVDGESYTGRCECKDGYHGKLCQCPSTCNSSVADGYGCDC